MPSHLDTTQISGHFCTGTWLLFLHGIPKKNACLVVYPNFQLVRGQTTGNVSGIIMLCDCFPKKSTT